MNVEHNYLSTLSLAYSEGYVSNERLRYVLNLHRADITLLLKEMSVKGYLVSEGYGRGTKYHLPHVVQASNTDSNVGSNLGSNLESKPHKKRLSKKELFDFIVDACEVWIALDDIARTVERKPDYLLNEIIPLMLKEGLIERLYPENPRNPYQKYKRKE